MSLFEDLIIDDKRTYIINNNRFDAYPDDWPENSTFRIMYEGDKYSENYKLSNNKILSDTVDLISAVITKDIEMDKIDPDEVNWNNLKIAVNYLGLGVSVDYIYPLFLTQNDREIWYNDCESRRTYICRYDETEPLIIEGEKFEEEGKLIELKHNFPDEKSDYDTLGSKSFRSTENYFLKKFMEENSETRSKLVDDIFHELQLIPKLFVAGGIALALFESDKNLNDIDIFAYGQNALRNIIEGVKICQELAMENNSKFDYELGYARTKLDYDVLQSAVLQKYNWKRVIRTPIRTRYSITIPVGSSEQYDNIIDVQFILLESRSPYEILSRFDLDSSCIGFNTSEPGKFYGLPRTVRSLETRTNVVDPTRQSPTYIQRLIKYHNRGYLISLPGLNSVKYSSEMITKIIMFSEDKAKTVRSMKLTGLNSLLLSAFMGYHVSGKREPGDYSHMTGLGAHRLFTYYDLLAEQGKLDELAKLDEQFDSMAFVIGDVLNEGQKLFRIKRHEIDPWINYNPVYPKIELMENDPQNGMIGSIHQVKTSFYGQYYGVESIKL